MIFTKNLTRRKKFYLRAGLGIGGLFAVALAFPIVFYNAAWTSFLFISLFLLSLGVIKLCYDESMWNVVFCGLAAYTIQHIAFIITSVVNSFCGIVFGLSSVNPYLETPTNAAWWELIIQLGVYLVSYVTTYMIAYLSFPEKIRPDGAVKLGRLRFVILTGIILLSDNIFNSVTLYTIGENSVAFWIERAYNILTCILAIQLQFSQLNEKETQASLIAVKHILREEREQFEIIKQNLDYINIKCHDMKHKIRSIRAGGASGDDELDEIESVIDIYESVVQTGNEALDIILTEKNMLNGKDGISITCIADGARLSFMSPSDLYSLFGNALDNAIEAVKGLEPDKRNIGLTVKPVGNMVSIHIENYFDGNVAKKGGALVTTKPDKVNHGYGMLSMRAVTEKYHGTLCYDCDGDIFCLDILLPCAQTTDKDDERCE